MQKRLEAVAVANEPDTKAAEVGVFATAYCDLVSYRVNVKSEEFRIDDFLLAIKEIMGRKEPPTNFRCSSKNKESDYHLHVGWRKEEERGIFSLMIEVVGGYGERNAGEKEPFAEDFFSWAAKFFNTNEPQPSLVNADFEYPGAVRAVRVMLFPLPVKTEIGPKKVPVELDGLSFVLVSKPDGIEKVWITQAADLLRVHLLGMRKIDFKTFDPAHDVAVLAAVLDGVLEETKQ